MFRPVAEFLIGGAIACGLLVTAKLAPHIKLDAITSYGVILAVGFIVILWHLFGERK
jgi:hypothetical protein